MDDPIIKLLRYAVSSRDVGSATQTWPVKKKGQTRCRVCGELFKTLRGKRWHQRHRHKETSLKDKS